MENLNAEQVKKALECCKEGKCHNGCPLFDFCEVQDVLAGSSKLCGEALALINSQEQRIKELTEETDYLRKRMHHLFQSKFIASFDKWDRKTKTYERDIAEADKIYKATRAEAIIEIWGKTKTIIQEITQNNGYIKAVAFNVGIDLLLNEMLMELEK